LDQISVIIVNWNGKKFLSECLEGLRRQVYRSFSSTLVDNGSTDGSVDFVLQKFPEVRVVELSENTGFSVANNIIINSVKTEYVALLNNDAVPHPLWLQKLVEGLENNPEAGFIASKMLFYDKTNIIDRVGDSYSKAGSAFLRGRGALAHEYDEKELIFGACAGAALYRTRMFREIGLFDEDFFLLYEDVDLSFRAQLKGYKCVYTPEAIVYHKGSKSIVHDSPISVYYSHRNLEWTYIKNMPRSLIHKTILSHFIYDIASFFYFMIRGRGKIFLKAKLDALKGFQKALQKRRQIQGEKSVADNYIWSLFEKELLYNRLTRRLQRY
jgi:GT2 family glycosyltransferase